MARIPLRTTLVLTLAGAVGVGVAAPALADPDDPASLSEQGCVVIEPQHIDHRGVTVTVDRQTLCHAETVSPSSASLSASYGGGEVRVGIDSGELVALVPEGGGGGGGTPPSPPDIEALIADVREHLGIDDFDLGETYRHWVEDHAGGDVYENTVCTYNTWDDGENYVSDYVVEEYSADLDCYATDYLLGDYVRNGLLDWADRVVPGGIPAPLRALAETVIDELVDTTNRPLDVPAVPAVPPTPPTPPTPALPPLT